MPFLLLALAALALGALIWQPLPPGIWHDDGVYLMLGHALAEGEGLRYAGVPGAPLAPKFPPLYPAVAAVAWMLGGDAIGAARVASWLNVAFLAAAAGLSGAWARRGLGLPLPLALAVGALAALSVDLWRPALVALSEPLYVLVMVGSLWLAARAERPGSSWRELAALVASLTLLVHVRTAGVAVAVAAVVALAARWRWRDAALVAGALAALALPWALWSSAASASLPGPLRDVLGPYGSWLGRALMDDPLGYAYGLGPAAVSALRRSAGLLFPAATSPLGWLAVPLLGLGVLAGCVPLARRSPTAALSLALSLAMAWLWPFQSYRLFLPLLPLLLAALACAACASWRLRGDWRGSRRARFATLALLLIAAWAVAFVGVSAVRLAQGGASAAYEIRARSLASALDAMSGRVPPGAVVGAPELWPALALLTDLRTSPSARFLPVAGEGMPRYGTPRQQFRLWAAAGVDHLLLEQGGAIHGPALDSLEAACPGTVGLLDVRPGLILVRLGWDEACRRRVGALP